MRFAANHGLQVGYVTLFTLACLSVSTLTGCQKAAAVPPPPKPPEVQFVRPTPHTVTEFDEFSGRTWSPETVELRARVTGYLKKVRFEDGDDVAAEQPLFEIDDRTYKAERDRAAADVERAKSQHLELKGRYDRAKRLRASRTISEEEYENLGAQTSSAEAAVTSAQAALELAQLNLDFTTVKSPISGRIGRRLVDEGNLIKEDDTILANVVSLNPIYAYFDFDERTVLKMRRNRTASENEPTPEKSASPSRTPTPNSAGDSRAAISSEEANRVFMKEIVAGLAGDQGFPLKGQINWVDNQVDVGTGTLRARAELKNDSLLLSPGMFVRLRVPVGEPEQRLLIPEEALGSNQGLRFVYVVDDEGIVSEREVEIGWLEGTGRVIKSGLAAQDRVVVTGLQRIRAKMKVVAKEKGSKELEPAATSTDGTGGKPAAPKKAEDAAPTDSRK